MIYDNVKRVCEKQGISISTLEKNWNFRTEVSASGMTMSLVSAKSRK